MVIADRTDGVEAAQIVFVRRIVAMPADHVQRRMIDACRPKMALEFRDQFEIAFDVFVSRDRREEIAGVGQAIRPNRPEVGQPEHRAKVFANVTTRRAVRQRHRETQAARNHRDFLRLDLEDSKLGRNPQSALLRHDQQLTVGIVKVTTGHIAIGRVQMNADTRLPRRTAVASHGEQAVEKIGRCRC